MPPPDQKAPLHRPVPFSSFDALSTSRGRFALPYIPDDINGFRIIKARYADGSQLGTVGPWNRLKEMQSSFEEILELMTAWYQQKVMLINANKITVRQAKSSSAGC